MIVREKYTASVIGAGNLAYSLVPALQNTDVIVKSIVSRDGDNANSLGSKYGVESNILRDNLELKSQLIFLTVSDDYIEEVANRLTIAPTQVLIHTSGSTELIALKKFGEHYGVLYPLQSFTKDRLVDFSRIPVCVEASDVETLNILQDIAGMLSSRVMILSSKQRKQLHLAGVFVSNFTNHMYNIGQWLLEKEKLDFSLFYPLIDETSEKVKRMKPKEAQTGPAVRGNVKIMEEHKKMLKQEHELYELYKVISKSIKDFR